MPSTDDPKGIELRGPGPLLPCLRFRLQHSTALGSAAVQPPNCGRMEPQGAGLRVTAHLFNLGGVEPGPPLCTEG